MATRQIGELDRLLQKLSSKPKLEETWE